jgi:hypothetical protein
MLNCAQLRAIHADTCAPHPVPPAVRGTAPYQPAVANSPAGPLERLSRISQLSILATFFFFFVFWWCT